MQLCGMQVCIFLHRLKFLKNFSGKIWQQQKNNFIFASAKHFQTCYAISYISIRNGLVRWAITVAGRAFQ
jgi:hypothetical protein